MAENEEDVKARAFCCSGSENLDRHVNAIALIVAAAKQSGLLNEIAEALCYINKNPQSECCNFDCRACAIYEDLVEVFDDNIGLSASAIERFSGDGINVGPFTEAELAPYLAH